MGLGAQFLRAAKMAGQATGKAGRTAKSAAGKASTAVRSATNKAGAAIGPHMPQMIKDHPYMAGGAGLAGVLGLASLASGGDDEELAAMAERSGIPADMGILGDPSTPSIEDIAGSAAKRDRVAKQVRQQLKARIERMVKGQYPPERILNNLMPYMQGITEEGGEGDDMAMLAMAIREAAGAEDPNEIIKGIYGAVQ